jgi:hypothetical protein
MTGERFNIFSILGLQSAENRTHSAFLRELLDPEGSHGMKDTFLKSFIRMVSVISSVGIEGELELGWKGQFAAKVEREQHVGYISEDGSKGGRIDLVITPTSGGRNILIENKIDAGDQKYQLVRYRNHDKDALLLYLTLDGKEASHDSTQHPGSGNMPETTKLAAQKHYFLISYKTHILKWLEECRKEASSHPLVRETIAQYINLIRNFTEQSISHKMDNDIEKNILNTHENFKSSKNIAETYYRIINERKYLLKNEIGKLPELHVIEFNQLDIYVYFCTEESTPYISFYAKDKDGAIQNLSFKLEECRLILNKSGFKSNQWHLGWKTCSFWSDENMFFDICKSSLEEALQKVLIERDNYINNLKLEIDKIDRSH